MLHFILSLNRHSFKFHQRRQVELHLSVASAMSSFVDAILKKSVDLLVNKGRNVAAEKLKDGDVTNEQLRNSIVSELDDIKSKLDGIARKGLLTSIGFFKEGLVYLYKVKPNEEDGKKTQQREVGAATPLKQEIESSEASVKTVSLVEEMRSLQLTDQGNSSSGALNDAKDRFKQAREKATEAFYNEALSTSDRILAMQYRIMATILEKVDCLPDALAACRLCLEELHSMPAVKKSLDVHLQQGFKSMFNKAEREDAIGSVCRINRVIFHIAEIVEEDNDIPLWPCIDHGKDKIDPLRDIRVTQTIEKEDPQYFLLKTWPFFQEGEEPMKFEHWLITINSKGQLMIVATDGIEKCTLLKLFDRNGNLLQSLQFKLPAIECDKYSCRRVNGLASDRANNVFILNDQRLHQYDRFRGSVVVFDHQANFQHEFALKEGARGVRIAVSDHNKVLVLAEVEEKKNRVQVYNFNGVLLYSVEMQEWGRTVDLSSIDPEGDKILVLGSHFDFRCDVEQSSEQGSVLSEYHVVSGFIGPTYFLHNTEHVAELNVSRDELWLIYKKNGEVVREIKLKLSSLTDSFLDRETFTVRAAGRKIKLDQPTWLHACKPLEQRVFTVTTQGLVAMLVTDKRTGKRMIAIL
ncbi:uncharacterized protein LOC122963320 [Acropora millepora]|uniref:uncharacterized protein LOC122963320 n=1 Tax=Acropora millepora TaxID=45264 RepID=UPI001CF0FDAC|nr:uncharacterized protein LOC122963320 [Acropora millepora]